MSRRVFVTGGTGFIGRALITALRRRGDDVIALSRNAARARTVLADAQATATAQATEQATGQATEQARGDLEIIEGDGAYGGEWQAALANVDAVINLAGQGIADKRWNAHYKQLLRDSRVETTRYLVEAMAALDAEKRPRVLINASGIDYYPFGEDLGAVLAVDDDDDVDERTPPGSTFLARVCRSWETEAEKAEPLGVRVVRMRMGVILGREGALQKMVGPFRFFVGGRIGNGRQWFSWLHIDDAVAAYLFALDHDTVSGALNLVAPEPVRSGAFAKALGRALGRPSWLPVPAFALKAAVGEFSEYLLNGRRAVPRALLQHGFEFAYPDLASALGQIYGSAASS